MLLPIKQSPVFRVLFSGDKARKIYGPAVFFLLVLGLGSVVFWPRQALAEITVDASLSHRTFAEDRGARLTLTVTGTNHDVDIDLPQIDNIVLRSQGTSRQFSVVNGSISSSIAYNYLVQARQPGSYTIPPIRVTAEGKSYLSQALKFEVTKAGQQVNGVAGPNDQAGGQLAFIRISEAGSHYSERSYRFVSKPILRRPTGRISDRCRPCAVTAWSCPSCRINRSKPKNQSTAGCTMCSPGTPA